MNLIYSCVFFKVQYLKLLDLLLKSYITFNQNFDSTYLIITQPSFEDRIKNLFLKYKIKNFDIFTLNLSGIFEACASRLHIFDYPKINLYQKILYLDTDILITNNINNLFNLEIKEYLYVLKENYHREFHCCLFQQQEINEKVKDLTFTSGILYFKNSLIIKNLFIEISNEIKNYNQKNLPPPKCYDQPFFVYYGIKQNLIENKSLIGLCVNNPKEFNKETITHFPECVGNHKHKLPMMFNYFNYLQNLPKL
jgi:hypothetical protein